MLAFPGAHPDMHRATSERLQEETEMSCIRLGTCYDRQIYYIPRHRHLTDACLAFFHFRLPASLPSLNALGLSHVSENEKVLILWCV
jgi:hypothetical protein